MSKITRTAVQRGLGIAWLIMVVLLVGLIVFTQVLPMLGQTLYVIRGRSMEPAIPIGAMVAVSAVNQGDLRVGDIITLRHNASQILTHRIVGLDSADGRFHVRTQGDANQSADLGDHAATDVVGRVEWHLPLAGFVLAFLSAPAGMVAVIAFLGAFLLATWLLEDLRWGRTKRPLTPRSASGESTA
jgi:signal peptidase I